MLKNTLTRLWVYCNNFDYESRSIYSAPYEVICNQTDQFKNLNTLYLETPGLNCLSYFDELIDKFHSLETLDFSIIWDFQHRVVFIEPEPTVLPRPDIQTLKCFWCQIRNESQLEYLIHKFPNLQRLVVEPWCDEIGTFGPAFGKFIQYVLSVPDFKLSMELTKEQTLDVWDEFTKTKNGCNNVTLYHLKDHFSPAMYKLELSTTLGWRLGGILQPDVDELPHIQFLSEVGNSLRSLRINDAILFQRINNNPRTITWLSDILQLCPLLEELTICNPKHSSPIYSSFLDFPLKRLILSELKSIQAINFLEGLSLSIPHLCQLSLSFIDKDMGSVIIDMPYTSLDLLIWNKEFNNIRCFKGSEVYIKLDTDKGLEYYLGEKSMLFPITENRYLLSLNNVRFDISCKHLKEFRIRRALPERNFSFIFQP